MSTIAMQQHKVMGWSFEEAVVQDEKSELELSLEDVNAGKVVNVGTVDNLMKYLHS